MRVPSGRAATATLLVAALAVLLVAGRLLAPAPSSQRARLPDVVGQRVAQATAALRRLGLEGRRRREASRRR
jgi:beta-lactam-binding protein with PASTA domain